MNTNPNESVTVKLVLDVRQTLNKSDTWKGAVFLPEAEITFIYGADCAMQICPF